MEPGKSVQPSSSVALNYQSQNTPQVDSRKDMPRPSFPLPSTSRINATPPTPSDTPVAYLTLDSIDLTMNAVQLVAVQSVPLLQLSTGDSQFKVLKNAIEASDESAFQMLECFVEKSADVSFTNSHWQEFIHTFGSLYEAGRFHECVKGGNHYFIEFCLRVAMNQKRLHSFIKQFLFDSSFATTVFASPLLSRIEDFTAFLVQCQDKPVLSNDCWAKVREQILSYYKIAYNEQLGGKMYLGAQGQELFLSYFALLAEHAFWKGWYR